MTEHEVGLSQTIILFASGILLPIGLYISGRITKSFSSKDEAVKKLTADKINEIHTELHQHLDECNRIPKSLILSKLDNVCTRIDTIREDQVSFQTDVKGELKYIRERQDKGSVHHG